MRLPFACDPHTVPCRLWIFQRRGAEPVMIFIGSWWQIRWCNGHMNRCALIICNLFVQYLDLSSHLTPWYFSWVITNLELHPPLSSNDPSDSNIWNYSPAGLFLWVLKIERNHAGKMKICWCCVTLFLARCEQTSAYLRLDANDRWDYAYYQSLTW